MCQRTDRLKRGCWSPTQTVASEKAPAAAPRDRLQPSQHGCPAPHAPAKGPPTEQDTRLATYPTISEVGDIENVVYGQNTRGSGAIFPGRLPAGKHVRGMVTTNVLATSRADCSVSFTLEHGKNLFFTVSDLVTRAYYSVVRTLQTASTDTRLSGDLEHIHAAHTSLCGRTYWLEACLRNSSSVCLKVSKRHLFTVFSTLMTSPITEEQDNKLLGKEILLLLPFCFCTVTKNIATSSPVRQGHLSLVYSLPSVKARHTRIRKHSTPGAITQTRRPMPAPYTAPPAHPKSPPPLSPTFRATKGSFQPVTSS